MSVRDFIMCMDGLLEVACRMKLLLEALAGAFSHPFFELLQTFSCSTMALCCAVHRVGAGGVVS